MMRADQHPKPVPPGGRIGILGGGQLGRMLALAAARLGLQCHIFSDVPGAPAEPVSAVTQIGAYTDDDAIREFAAGVDVVTYEFENIPVATLDAAEREAPVYPPRRALQVAQDRLLEKQFLADLGLPLAAFASVDSDADLAAGLRRIGLPAILKTRRLGYDGKGQCWLMDQAGIGTARGQLGHAAAVLETMVPLAGELSVIAVRGRDGGFASYDCPANVHRQGILHSSTVPAQLPQSALDEARAIAGRIAAALHYVGVIGVEFFVDHKTQVLVNEIAPRVHNSGHWTLEACCVSQFENHVRAVAGWPLGSTDRHSDAHMVNLIGTDVSDWQALASEPNSGLHLYGKRDPRPGRKMGHITRIRPKS